MQARRRYEPTRTRHRRGIATRPFVAFLLIASFGLLFVGCASSPPEEDVFTFTEDDVARFRELAGSSAGSGTGETMGEPRIERVAGSGASRELPKLDLSMAKSYDAIRSGPTGVGEELYRVTNAYLNVRSEAKVTASEVARLSQGDQLTILDFIDAAWAKTKLDDGKEGYVSTRYIAKLVSEEQLAAERKKYEGVYFVDFGFLNVRKAPDAGSEKIGELPGQALVRPISMDKVWARVPFANGEGYVAVQYLSPFAPQFLVRQETYKLPVLQYKLTSGDNTITALRSHIAALKQAGVTLWTLRDLRQLVLTQEDRDARVPPKTALLVVSDVTVKNVQEVSHALQAAGVSATLFLRTADIGIGGITEKTVLSLSANGFDVQSGGHTGDDLRSLTNAQMQLELEQSRVLLEEMTGKPVFAIGYPIGGVNERVMQFSGEAGYLFGVGSAPEASFSRTQFLRLPSFIVSGSMTPEDVVGIVKGKEQASIGYKFNAIPRNLRTKSVYLAFA
ncbi:hypothetical protein A3C37_01430 [Candidatus Peribacteria bacterium RIFCSPHIGHO2_02_FULL_53_20]|nr:MAG: hypothetical protein A3C37_01430 [Candidatus Peribacteria bacterium RIFCSPHIGHO2_02_FULL_53_20]OGJ67165.1 MAG: hypothetical protein A3B61_03240 [Candidatus Peribacteria bacterium RIFCSPLOWO2_01_FULL_53_10]OGJ75002.1 MAG: hypothetical protein A3G69_00745 [Candidatus Peribacteria bacterium RIFCSPLOWO2_12_FULL_53_10]